MAVPKFWIENPDGDEEREEFFVGEKSIATFNHDEHGWQGMRDAGRMFENIAEAVGAKFERRLGGDDDR